MSEQIREQVSAFLDGELPNSEAELLLKRLTRDAELRESFGRYALIGESLRGGGHVRLTQGFTARVNRAIDGESPVVVPGSVGRSLRWWRPIAGVAVAAGVATVAVFSFQQRSGEPVTAGIAPTARPVEALSYTVPVATGVAAAGRPAARLTNYVFAHSRYSAVMGQNDVLNDLLSAEAADDGAAHDASRNVPVAP